MTINAKFDALTFCLICLSHSFLRRADIRERERERALTSFIVCDASQT